MLAVLHREMIYLWYYFTILLEQIMPYWFFGIVLGSFISVFGKEKIHRLLIFIQNKQMGVFGVIPASILGIVSPMCMYDTIPLAAALSEGGMKDDWLAAFMMSSILLNPQLIIYSAALGMTALTIRILFSFLCGVVGGLLVRLFFRNENFFDFDGFSEPENRDTSSNPVVRFLKNIGRNIKATGLWFFLGILLSVVFQRYIPSELIANLFGPQHGFGVLMAATIGVPLYACGGGTIPLLIQWLAKGMSLGAASAFMITGPATKITNLGALKIVLGAAHFLFYLTFIILFALFTGFVVNLVT